MSSGTPFPSGALLEGTSRAVDVLIGVWWTPSTLPTSVAWRSPDDRGPPDLGLAFKASRHRVLERCGRPLQRGRRISRRRSAQERRGTPPERPHADPLRGSWAEGLEGRHDAFNTLTASFDKIATTCSRRRRGPRSLARGFLSSGYAAAGRVPGAEGHDRCPRRSACRGSLTRSKRTALGRKRADRGAGQIGVPRRGRSRGSAGDPRGAAELLEQLIKDLAVARILAVGLAQPARRSPTPPSGS
jgi:hypothetical protein